MKVEAVKDGVHIRPGHVYVAQPDKHLFLRGDQMALTRKPKTPYVLWRR